MRISLVFILSVISFSSCLCEQEELYVSCEQPVACYLPPNVENTEKNLLRGDVLLAIRPKGVCKFGVTKCDSDGKLFCDGYILPSEEICDDLDNNCNGEIDEGFDFDGDGYKICDGDCVDTNKNIYPGAEESCNRIDDDCDGIVPQNETEDLDNDGIVACRDCNDRNENMSPNLFEVCDGLDNDCDGEIDENVSESWYSCGPRYEVGACKRGFNECINGELYCVGAVFEGIEVCDAVDNDCDGFIDESLNRLCQTQCGFGEEYCSYGSWLGCTAPLPATEICDGLDNDCDGEIDENCTCTPGELNICTTNVIDPNTNEALNCGIGLQSCTDDREWGPCYFNVAIEEKCNNHDDDCDGEIDNIVKECFAGDAQYALVGECSSGYSECLMGEWSECYGAVPPEREICNNKDDNCNGEIDENLDSNEKVDMVFMIDVSGSMCSYIQALASGISQYVSDFENSEHMFAFVVYPSDNIQYPQVSWRVVTDLTNVNTFLSSMTSTFCDGLNFEPSYDVMRYFAIPTTTEISWRHDARPYLILITDEPAQSANVVFESDVAAATSNCQVGNCSSGDTYETFIITREGYFPMWDEVVFGENDRLISIEPPEASAYVEKLKNVFTNVCLIQ